MIELFTIAVLFEAFLISLQTDTASVLSEAMEYIQFLHEQVKVGPFPASAFWTIISSPCVVGIAFEFGTTDVLFVFSWHWEGCIYLIIWRCEFNPIAFGCFQVLSAPYLQRNPIIMQVSMRQPWIEWPIGLLLQLLVMAPTLWLLLGHSKCLLFQSPKCHLTEHSWWRVMTII